MLTCDFPSTAVQVAPNTTLVAVPGQLGAVSSVISATITGAVALTSMYFQWRQQHDAEIHAEHEAQREAARVADAQAAQLKALQMQAQTAAVQTATSGAQGASGVTLSAPMAAALGSPMMLVAGVAVVGLLAVVLLGRRR